MRELAPAILSLQREAHHRGGQVVIAYIAEAHAADEWPINSTRCRGPGNTVNAPRTLVERTTLARRMVATLGLEEMPTYADGTDDALLEAYAAWPIRAFGIANGRLGAIAHPESATFCLHSLRDWLLAACETPSAAM